MQKFIRILLFLILLILLFMGFLVFRSCSRGGQEGLINPVLTATPDPEATPSATPYNETAGSASPSTTHEPWADPLTMTMGDRGTTVAQVQDRLRALGYFNYKSSGYFVSMTKQALINFQTANSLTTDGLIGSTTLNQLFSSTAKRASVTKPATAATPPPTVRPRENGEAVAWSEVSSTIAVSSKFLIVDYSSQLYFYAVRVGGTNHMEIEPASVDDTAKCLAIFSGQASYEKRACLVQWGDRFFAASLCGMPHGSATVQGNSLNGQLCLYFSQSTAEGLPITDAEHTANILKASGQ